MLIKGNDVIGLKVLTLSKGQQIEDVEDIIYDPSENQVKALLVDKGGLFSDAKVIPLSSVKSIGKDAVMVKDVGVIKKASEVGEKVSHIAHEDTYLTKTRIVTESGTDLGHVTDLYFDDHTGVVHDLEVSQGLKDLQSGKKKVKVSDILTVGKDATIVRVAAESRMQKQARSQGVQGGITAMHKRAPTFLDEAKETLSSLGQKTSAKARELQEKAAEQIQPQQSSSDIQRGLEKTANATREKMLQGKEKITEIQRENAVGKYVTKNILTRNDDVLAVRGDLITNGLLDEAEGAGVLGQMLANISNNPVSVEEEVPIDVKEKTIITSEQKPQEYAMYGTLGGQKKSKGKTYKSTKKKGRQK